MSVIKDGVTVINPGETLMGIHEGRLVNSQFEGREVVIAHENMIDAAEPKLVANAIGRRTYARIMRNTTGAKLNPGEIVKIDVAAGIAGTGKASSLSAAEDRFCYVVDPLLPVASGVADDDLFLAYYKGPAKVLMSGDGLDLSGGAGIRFTAGANGHPALIDGSPVDGSLMGSFLVATAAAANLDKLVEVILHPDWE